MIETSFSLVDDETPPIPTAQVSISRAYGLRHYQGESIASVLEGFKDPEIKRQLVAVATGGGKTIIFSALASLNSEKGGKTLILAHTDELIDQAIEKFKKSTGLRAAKEKASSYASRFEKVVVGSVQSLCGDVRLSMWKGNHFTLVIVDEAHRSLAASYQKILQHFGAGGAHIVGFTATPDRGDRRSLGEFYQRVAYDYGLLHACRDGWLVRPMVQTIPLNIDLRGVKTKKTNEGTDFDRMEVGQRLAPFLDKIAEEIRARAGSSKIIVFLPSVESAQLMAQALIKSGISAEWVCGDRNICPDRKERIARHKANKVQALCNMALLTEGYDDDEIQYLVVLRPTKIRSLYAQMVGRGTRPLGSIVSRLNAAANAAERVNIIKNSAKPCLHILDFLWLYEKHDLIKPANLVAPDEKVAKQMGDTEGDLIAAEERAERDLLAALEKEVRKNSNRKASVIDPLAIAVTELHDLDLAQYEPETDRDAMDPSEKQLAILKQNGIDTSKIRYRGEASRWINIVLKRHELGLATFRQLNFMKQLGIEHAASMKRDEATAAIDRKIGRKEANPATRQEEMKL
jgi:superfamily II DNA or RNA helicase